MNGADALIDTLALNGVTACFANPGTSEMQFVAALDRQPKVRPILCLFEGVATGAADGYGRMSGHPACTLLHLGPGYGNGLANLHNARKAFTPIVNVVGDHATYHRQFDAPLNSDLPTIVRPNSIWFKSADAADEVAALTAEAISASLGPPGGPVSLILPADAAWTETLNGPITAARAIFKPPSGDTVDQVAKAIRSARRPALLLGGQGCSKPALDQAARLNAIGVMVVSDTFVARQARGAGVFAPTRMPYYGEAALEALQGVDLMVYAGAAMPVAFFAYPGKPSILLPEGCQPLTLAHRDEDVVLALASLAEALGAPKAGPGGPLERPGAPTGDLTPQTCGASIARHLPEGAVLCDDSVTSGGGIAAPCQTAAPHEVLALTGGSIGIAMPLAIGAGVAAPDRKIVALSGDGAGMYTVQSLWTMARESLDVTVVVFANRAYRVLHFEMARTGGGKPGKSASQLLGLDQPTIDWCGLSRGLGVPAIRCETAEQFELAFAGAMQTSGPKLLEVVL